MERRVVACPPSRYSEVKEVIRKVVNTFVDVDSQNDTLLKQEKVSNK